MAMGGEPPRKPIYVSSKNDPRLKAYQDSLILHSNPTNYKTAIGVDAFIELNKINKKYPKPIYDDKTGKIEYKKPIQPVEYRPKITPTVITKPIYVNNKNNSLLRDYQDSLALYKIGEEKKLFWKNNPNATNIELNRKEDEINKKYPLSKNRNTFGTNMIEAIGMTKIGKGSDVRSVPQYKKPVQPVAYKPEPKVTTDTRKIQMETTKLDTVPIIKTPPTPLTKKQYYEVPDANGKNVLLTPEQFSRMSSGNKNDLMSKSPIINKPKYFYEMNSSGKRQLVPENKIREYMQTKNK
jgi:hypothetical protein